MLNELYEASMSLQDFGVNPKDWDQKYMRVPKLGGAKPTFFVFIGSNNQVTRIERIIDANEIDGLRKWQKANGYSFPYFNIPPLWRINFEPKKNEKDKVIEQKLKNNRLSKQELQQFMNEKTATAKEWEANQILRIDDCLRKLSNEFRAIVGTPPPELCAIAALIERVSEISGQQFYDEIKDKFSKCMLADPSSARLYFGGAFQYRNTESGNPVSILLELDDGTSAFEYPVKHFKVRDWINERLFKHQITITGESGQPDVFGKDLAGSDKKYPDVTVNVLGSVKLRAMNHESLCQYRYGQIGQKSCLVGDKSRMLMKGALEWLTDSGRKGKTWDTVARATSNKEILLAYPSVLPKEPPNVAVMFSGGLGENDTMDNTSQFENCAHEVTGTLQGLMAQNPDLDFRVFVLRKMDTARTRVSNHRRYSAQHLINAANNWQIGCRNLPYIQIKQFSPEKKPEWCDPKIPFPMEIVWTLNTLRSRDGGGAQKTVIKGLATDDGISLLLEEGVFLRQILLRALGAATRNAVGLVLALGQAQAQRLVFTSVKNDARQAVILPSILGLLLFKMNITKEEYMKSPPYLIGRLLSLSDQLHYHYCEHERDKKVPPQLLGNALMPNALEEPCRVLAHYFDRLKPYHAWAQTVQGEPAGLARYFLAELGKVALELSKLPIPERCTDIDRTQMMIGYLARSGKSESETAKQGDEK